MTGCHTLNALHSHATKERANGRIDMIPADASNRSILIRCMTRYKILVKHLNAMMSEAATLRERLTRTMNYEAYQQTKTQAAMVGGQMQHIQDQLAELRQLVKSARKDAAFALKWHMAKTMLRVADIEHINKQCDLLVGEIMPISTTLKQKSTGEKQGESHVTRARAMNRNQHRREARKNLEKAEKEGLIMYSDSRFRQNAEPQRYSTPVVEVMPKKLQQLADHFNKKQTK